MTYNITYLDTSNNIVDVFTGLNNLTPDLFGGLMLGSLFLVAMAVLYRQDTTDQFLLSSFITSFVAVMLFAFGAVGILNLTIPMLMLFAAIIMKVWVGR